MIASGIKPTAETGSEIEPVAQFFKLKSPLLAQGRLNNVVARTNLLQVVVKVYAEGGENAMHKHPFVDLPKENKQAERVELPGQFFAG